MAKVKRQENKPNFLFRMTMRIAAVLFVIFCIASIISAQSGIVEKEQQLAQIEEDIEIMKTANEELQDIIESDDIGRYMEKLAVENSSYSYAYPDERRYYDTSRD